MHKPANSQVNSEILAQAQEAPLGRIWCEVCNTDEYIFVERARWRRRRGEGYWDIDYTCTNCDSFYGHVVTEADVTSALMSALTAARDGHGNGSELQAGS